MTEVPVIVLANLTESQRRALVIADNQLALNAGWDEEILRLELAALQEEDFDLNLVGFDDEELARLLAEQDATFGCSRWQSALDSVRRQLLFPIALTHHFCYPARPVAS